MGFIQDYFFEIIVFTVGAGAVVFTAIALWIAAVERKRRRDDMEDAVYEMYLEQKKAQREKMAASQVQITAKQKGEYTVALEATGGPDEVDLDEEEGGAGEGAGGIPAARRTSRGVGAGYQTVCGVRIGDLADPPISVGKVQELNSGKALLLSLNMQKVMPRPSGGLLSRTMWIDEVPQLKDPEDSSSALYLLHPGANYHSIGLSFMAPAQLTNYPISAGIRVSLKFGTGGNQVQDLPVTVDGVASQQLDVAAIWDTKGLESFLKDTNNPFAPTTATLVVHFDGFPKLASVSFDIKVQFASRQRMVPREDELYKVPMEFITQAPRWALDMLNGQPIVLKFNMLKAEDA